MSLIHLGFSSRLEQQFEPFRLEGLRPARVVREDRGRYRVHDGAERAAEVSGRFRHETTNRADYPAVGDWVAVRSPEGAGAATITAVLPRSTVFIRHAVGEATEPQVVAANIDTVFVVAGLDGDFNVRRLERYVTATWESGAQPVIVLNKADVAADLEAQIAETELSAPGVPVVPLSAREAQGLEALAAWLAPGATVALLGSSGVGKSTLVNALLGRPQLATQEVRESDSRGRHTTSHRELVMLAGGTVLIDTPGMRESALEEAFPEIETLARECRFGDCRHEREPGCAVLRAEAAGTLDLGRLASWRKLQRELRWLAGKQDRRVRIEAQARWKAIHRSMKSHPKLKARGER